MEFDLLKNELKMKQFQFRVQNCIEFLPLLDHVPALMNGIQRD